MDEAGNGIVAPLAGVWMEMAVKVIASPASATPHPSQVREISTLLPAFWME
jgi:hypothetical protein